MIILFLIFKTIFGGSACYYYQNNSQMLNSTSPYSQMDQFSGVGYGYWFKYQPYTDINMGNEFTSMQTYPSGASKSSSQKYLLSVESFNRTTYTIFHYVTIDSQSSTILHQVDVLSQNRYQIINKTFTPLNYEGRWIFFGIQFDTKIEVLFYLESLTVFQIDDQIRQTTNMRYYLGWYGTIQSSYNNSYLTFSQFNGRMTNFIIFNEFITQENKQNTLLSDCAQKNYCSGQNLYLIFTQCVFKAESLTQYNFNTYYDGDRYAIYLWAKVNPQLAQGTLTTVLLRISLNQPYTDQKIGDKEIYIEYVQSPQPTLNGINITTYSYSFPADGPYTITIADKVQINSSALLLGLTYWHYIQFEYGRTTTTYNSLFNLFVPSIGYTATADWKRKNYHFTGSSLFFYIGGGTQQNENLFSGTVFNLTLLTCFSSDLSLLNKCDYTCETCSGPTSTDCLTCFQSSNRELSFSQCLCKDGFVETGQNVQCYYISQIYPSLQVVENEYPCSLVGYDQCGDKIVCSFGYFLYQNQCLQCPEQQNKELSQNLFCQECLLNPKSWNFVCTYDLISLNSNQVFIPNLKIQPNLYNLTQISEQYEFQFCEGYSKFCSPKCQLNYTIPSLSVATNFLCQKEYYIEDESCQFCGEGCDCSDIYPCQKCQTGYAFNLFTQKCDKCNICSSCLYRSETLICSYCPSQYFLNSQGQCIPCGYGCSSCDLTGCLYCFSGYFHTFDGINCQQCTLSNCKVCYQYYVYDGDTYQTIDLNFIHVEISDYNVQTVCARCSDNYYIYEGNCAIQQSLSQFDTQSTTSTSSSTTTTNTGGSTQGNTGSMPTIPTSVFDQCTTGIVINNAITCLIGSSYTAKESSSCTKVSNCQNCISNYVDSSNQCIICVNGFYVNIYTGVCQQCPDTCATCVQQHKVYKDAWKRLIRAYYQVVYNSNGDHLFEDYALDTDISNYEIVCLSCVKEKLLYNGGCITDCGSNCQNCQVIDGAAKCMQCKQNTFGFIRSTNSTEFCIDCPYRCSGCIIRGKEASNKINLYYDYDNVDDNSYSNQCYQQYDTGTFLDNEINVAVKCTKYKKCYNSISITINAFCNQTDFSSQFLAQSSLLSFTQSNCYIDDLESKISQYFDQGLLDYLNKIAIKQADIIINLIQGRSSVCQFNTVNLNQLISKYVFSLLNVSLTITSDNSAKLQINQLLKIENYSNITFSNLNFVGQAKSSIYLEAMEPIYVNIINCSYVMNGSDVLSFLFENLLKLTIKNLTLNVNQAYASDAQIFTFKYNDEYVIQGQVLIDGLIIQESQFYNTNIFLINYQFSDQLIFTTTITNMQFINSSFYEGFRFFNQKKALVDVGNIFLDNIIIDKCQFLKSSIVLANNVYSSSLNNLIIQNSAINQSSLFQIVVLQVTNAQILNNQIFNSQIFSNVGNYYTIDPTEQVLFQNIIFNCNQYIGSQIFIKIIQESDQNLNVQMQSIQMINNSYTQISLGYQNFQSLSYTNSNIYINADQVWIQDMQIYRAPGLPEISIIQSINLTIVNLQISTLGMYRSKILSPNIECFQQQSYLDFYFSLFIYDFLLITINQISIKSVYSFDYAIIVLQSANLLSKQQNEIININDGIFISNYMLIQNNNKQTGIIQIKSQQVQIISLKNLQFNYNILNQYVQDLSKYSSSTLQIESDQGNLNIDNCQFTSNYLINSTNSPLQIQSQSIYLSNTKFTNNNVFDFDIIKYFIIWGYQDNVSYEQIYQSDLQIQSSGGSGQFITQYLVMQNVNLDGSYGLQGGGFYISSQGDGSIIIADSCFSNSQTADTINANGGLFYIDAQKSRLNLEINNIDVRYVKSRSQGGFLFLNPSEKYNYIQIQNVKCTNCFSFLGGFIIIEFSTSSTVIEYPTLYMDNITLTNPEIKWQLESTFSLTTNEVYKIQSNSYLIYLSQIILQLNYLNVYDGSLYGILYIDGVNGVSINYVSILDYKPFQTPLISISQSTVSFAQINLQNILIDNIIHQSTISQQSNCDTTFKQIFSSKYVCSYINYSSSDYSTSTYYSTKYQTNNYYCNSNQIYGSVQSKFGVFEITDSTLSIIKINNVTMQYVIYNFLTYGLISIRDYTSQSNSIKISNLNLLNNKCDRAGCLLIAQDSGLIPVDLSTTSVLNRRILNENYDKLQNLSSFTAIISQSNFINNTAVNGSGVYLLSTNTVIRQCKFYGNNVSQFGGAIYFSDSTTNLYLYENIISNNYAQQTSGSGIYLFDKAMPKIFDLDVYINNNGDQDINELPYSLQLSLDSIKTFLNKTTITNNQSMFVEMIQINPYKILGETEKANYIMLPSGQDISQYQYFDPYQQLYIPYNLSLRVTPINKSGQRLYNLNDFKLKISAEIFNQTNTNSSITYVSSSEMKYNSTTQDFNLDYFQIYFNPYSDSYLEITLECTAISRPVYSSTPPYDTETQQSYQLKFRVKTFPCQLGEYYNSANQTCLLCTGSTYSVEYNSTSCTFKDDKTTSAVNQAMLKIQSGYWRAYYYSDIIDNCYHLSDNCLGGWKFGDSSCSKGHVGALCEQCDLYNVRGQGSYSVSSAYSCGSCAEVSGNALTIFLISIWTLISILMSVDSTVDIIEEHILKVKLKQLGYIIVDQRASPAVLIKVFTNYLQIITTISTFQLQVPTGISTVFNSVGNPISSMSYSLDCFLVNLSSIKIIYFRIIWSLLLAFLYIIVFLLGFFIAIQINKTSYNITVITTCLIYIYIYLQPNLVGSLISLISYRLISSQYWIQGNVSFRYDTQDHAKWLLSFVFPLLLIIGFIMPFLLWYGVHKNRDHLEVTKIKKRWGYLYNEYRGSAYYWETVKILQREYVIIVLAYYEDFIPIKAALVFLCLFFYSFVTNVKKPYNTGAFNVLDAQQTIVCAVSVILATTIYTAQQFNLQEIIWPFYLIIAILNTLFVLKLLFCLIEAYTSKLQENIDKIKDKILEKFPDLLNRYPFLKQFLENQDKRKKRIHNRYLQIKAYLMPQAKLIIQFKKDNRISLSERHVTHEDSEHKFPKDNKSVLQQSNFQMLSSPLQSSSIRSDDEKYKFSSSPKIFPIREEYPHKIKITQEKQDK